jgi:SAM-dependent methyltransferase
LLEYYQSGLGFDVTRVDSSQTAISIAEKNAREKGGRCRFIVADLHVNRQEVTVTFDFAFDWELLHHILPKDHQTYIRNVLRILNPRCHIPLRLLPRTGPPVWREREIPENMVGTTHYFSSESELQDLVSPYFRIRELKTIEIGGKFGSHVVIYLLAERR